MRTLITTLQRLAPFSPEAIADAEACLHTQAFQKNDPLLKQSAICRKLLYIDKGLVKTYFFNDDKEFIMRFFTEGALFTVVDSFVQQAPSLYNIMALEETTVTYLLHADLEILVKKHHCVETAYRKLLSIATTNMMKRISEMLEENATERYNHFLQDHGELLQKISLGDLAAYLGITQVSLSRIRGKK